MCENQVQVKVGVCNSVSQSRGCDTVKGVCVFRNSPIPISSHIPPAPGSAQQLQGSSLQQWCPSTTHYLEGLSLSRCYSGRNGVKLRCEEGPGSIGPFSQPLFMISLQSYTGKVCVWVGVCPLCLHSFTPTCDTCKKISNLCGLCGKYRNIYSYILKTTPCSLGISHKSSTTLQYHRCTD